MIELDRAGFRYRAGGWVFKDYSFSLEPGQIVAVIGPNGRGKTTLLKVMAGLLAPVSGRVRIGCQAGVVHQFSHTPFTYSVMDMVLMGRARYHGLFSSPGQKDFAIAAQALDQFGLLGFKHQPFHKLSGGERQLVLIARAVASGCQCLLLDEPASALDFRNQDRVLTTLNHLVREKQMSILFTTHYPQHAIHIADKVLMMYSETDYCFGPACDLMTDEALRGLYDMEIRNIRYEQGDKTVHTVIPVFS